MIRNCLGRLSLAVIALGPVAAGAQAAPAAPAIQVLTVYRETVKPGKGGAHDAHEVAWARALAAAKSPMTMLAISAMSGPAENWYMSLYPTWADYEKTNKAADASPAIAAIGKQYSALEGDFLSDARGLVGGRHGPDSVKLSSRQPEEDRAIVIVGVEVDLEQIKRRLG